MSILVYANFSICSSNVASKVAHTRRWKSHAVIFVRSPPHDNPKEIILEIIRLFWDSPPRKKNVQSIYNCYCHNLVFNSKVYGLTWFSPSSNHLQTTVPFARGAIFPEVEFTGLWIETVLPLRAV